MSSEVVEALCSHIASCWDLYRDIRLVLNLILKSSLPLPPFYNFGNPFICALAEACNADVIARNFLGTCPYRLVISHLRTRSVTGCDYYQDLFLSPSRLGLNDDDVQYSYPRLTYQGRLEAATRQRAVLPVDTLSLTMALQCPGSI